MNRTDQMESKLAPLHWAIIILTTILSLLIPTQAHALKGYDLDVSCLAINIYHEADWNSPDWSEGFAIAFSTINRVKERHLSICDVVFEPKQFSWTNGALDKRGVLLPEYLPNYHSRQWRESRRIAKEALSSGMIDFTHGATHYHADYIDKPIWTKWHQPVGKWGRHYFYR